MLRFFCINLGCQHVRGELYLSTGLLDSLPAMRVTQQAQYVTGILVFWCSVLSFIEWLNATAKLPFWIEFRVLISSLIMASLYWKETIFDKASTSVSQSNVDVLFLSLAASRILEMQNTNDGLMRIVGQQAPVLQQPNAFVTLAEATIGETNYTMDVNWMKINQDLVTRICICMPPIPIAC